MLRGGRLCPPHTHAYTRLHTHTHKKHCIAQGYLTQAQLERIPELVINPLASRFLSRFDNVNFKDFCSVLSFFGKSATKEDQIEFIFETFDSDGDGMVSKGDLMQMLQLLTGRFLMETEKEDLVDRYDINY